MECSKLKKNTYYQVSRYLSIFLNFFFKVEDLLKRNYFYFFMNNFSKTIGCLKNFENLGTLNLRHA